jgi:hypothetical protein
LPILLAFLDIDGQLTILAAVDRNHLSMRYKDKII